MGENQGGMSAGRRRLVLSPHFDDAALSCGGALARWALAGEAPVVVTIFAGRPAGPLSDFARFQHARWGDPADLIGLRRDEDRRAMATLGATPIWLEHADCIYRGDRYTTEASLFGPVAPDEAGLVEAIATEVERLWRAMAGAVVYLPLVLGNHVDHQVTRQAGERLAARGVPTAWHEDFPYAARPGGVERFQALTAGLRPEIFPIGDVIERKIAAIACYASQVPVLFGEAGAMPAAVWDYAMRVGQGEPAERYWRAAEPVENE